jgi:hypothetical protein
LLIAALGLNYYGRDWGYNGVVLSERSYVFSKFFESAYKVEELTLYVIEQNKDISTMKKEIQDLKKEIVSLK